MIRIQRSLLIAGAVLANAGIIFGGAVVRALTTETVPAPSPRAIAPQGSPTETPAPAVEAPSNKSRNAPARNETTRTARRDASELAIEDLMLAVDHDPFRTERQRPSERYKLPGEEILEEPPPPEAPPPPPAMRVLATAVTPTGGIALVQVQESLSRVLNVGESILGYTLASVGPGVARLEGNSGEVVLRVEEPQPNRPGRNARNTRQSSPAGRGQNGAAINREMEARAAQMRDAIEMLRANGGNPQQIRQLIEAMGREMELIRRNQNNDGGRGNGVIELQPVPGRDRIMVRPRPDTLMTKGN